MGVRARFRARPQHQGGPGVLHGGILVMALDEALGFVPALVHRSAVTARLETDFRNPVPVDSDVWVLAGLEGMVGRKFHVSGTARLHTPDGPVVATAARCSCVSTLSTSCGTGGPRTSRSSARAPTRSAPRAPESRPPSGTFPSAHSGRGVRK